MCVGGFEKDRKERGTLKKLCPAKHYGIECKYMNQCQIKQGFRIYITQDQRVFCPTVLMYKYNCKGNKLSGYAKNR